MGSSFSPSISSSVNSTSSIPLSNPSFDSRAKDFTPLGRAAGGANHFNFSDIDDLRSSEGYQQAPHARLRLKEEGEQRDYQGNHPYQHSNHSNPNSNSNSNSNPIPNSIPNPNPNPIQYQELDSDMDAGEQTYKLQYHKRGLFQQWVTVFVVIDGYSIRKYPDEKRSAKRCKEILLYDAAFSVAGGHGRHA